MVVAMMQPTFLPWAGYFAMLGACDTFVFLDDFQFQRHSFHHRNRLFLAWGQPGWVSVPVERSHGPSFPALNEVRPLLGRGFRGKFNRTLEQNYRKCEAFDQVGTPVMTLLGHEWSSLADLNIALIGHLSLLLELSPVFVRSSEIGSSGSRSGRVADLLGRLGATSYLAAAGAEEYMREDGVFPVPGVSTHFQNYRPIPYTQRHSTEFVPYLSVLDMLLQIGLTPARECIEKGSGKNRPWGEMSSIP